MSTYVNGYKVGEISTRTREADPKDNGHSIVQVDTLVDSMWRENVTLHCECGKKRSSRAGFGPAFNSIERHRRDEAKKVA